MMDTVSSKQYTFAQVGKKMQQLDFQRVVSSYFASGSKLDDFVLQLFRFIQAAAQVAGVVRSEQVPFFLHHPVDCLMNVQQNNTITITPAARCRLLAYGPADATASQNPTISCPIKNPYWLCLSGTGLPRLAWKRGR